MKRAMNPRKLVTLAAAAALLAALGGCGTDQETFHTGKNSVKTAPPSTDVATTPPLREPAVTVPETPAPPRDVTYAEAEGAYTAKRYGEAYDLFARYVEQKPGNPWGHYMLGLSAWKANNLNTAEESFRRAIALDTTHVKSYVNLARVLLDAGRPDEAYTAVDNALILDASLTDAWRVKGRACHTLGRGDEAVAAYKHAIRLDPEDAWSMNNLAFIWIEQERFEEALGPLARAIELRGEVAVFHNNLGMALERTGHLQAAGDAYAAAVTTDPSNQKAAQNGERLAAVRKDAGVAPVDLTALASTFASSIATWNDAELATATVSPEGEPSVQTTPATVDSTVSE